MDWNFKELNWLFILSFSAGWWTGTVFAAVHRGSDVPRAWASRSPGLPSTPSLGVSPPSPGTSLDQQRSFLVGKYPVQGPPRGFPPLPLWESLHPHPGPPLDQQRSFLVGRYPGVETPVSILKIPRKQVLWEGNVWSRVCLCSHLSTNG